MVDEQPESLRGVRQLLAGGDALSVAHVKRMLERLSEGRRLINGYGPTEGTTFTCCHVMDRNSDLDASVPIGWPIANTQVYVLDEQMQPVPIGVAGELYVGGDGLARCYLNRPGLTAEKFTPHPYSDASGARLYRTGDSVRRKADDTIEFLGRLDQQVKIRGFRIEPGEIETALAGHGAVKEAIVLARSAGGPGEKRLVAYVVLKQSNSLPAENLRAFLKGSLPEHMVPSAVIILDEMPLTQNGKVDRRALPSPEQAQAGAFETFVAPRTPIEEVLAGLWSEILNVERVGADADFFDLGGHSLLATQLVSRAREIFHADVSLRQLFEHPTVAGFAASIEEAQRAGQPFEAAPPIRQVPREGLLPLSFAQQRLWFLDQLMPGSSFYNISAAIRLSGQLNFAALQDALSEMVRRHEILRTTFAFVEGNPVQVIHPPLQMPLPVFDLSEPDAYEREARVRQTAEEEAQNSFDLAKGPLLRTSLLRLGESEHVLLVTMHHIISDGWSIGVMVGEVGALYAAFVDGRSSPLTELAVQYADFASWQNAWLSHEVLERELSYWKHQLAHIPAMLDLPTDRPRLKMTAHRGSSESFVLSEALSGSLKQLSLREGTTLFMTLLAAWQVLLARYAGQEDVCVGTPIANRNRVETESLIGFFVNTLVLRVKLQGNLSFTELLKQVREVCLGAYAHQDVPFEKLVEELQPERSLHHSPLFQVMFALQHAPMQLLELSGLNLSMVQVPVSSAKCDLLLTIQESVEGFSAALDYDTDFFDSHPSTPDRSLRAIAGRDCRRPLATTRRLASALRLRASSPAPRV